MIRYLFSMKAVNNSMKWQLIYTFQIRFEWILIINERIHSVNPKGIKALRFHIIIQFTTYLAPECCSIDHSRLTVLAGWPSAILVAIRRSLDIGAVVPGTVWTWTNECIRSPYWAYNLRYRWDWSCPYPERLRLKLSDLQLNLTFHIYHYSFKSYFEKKILCGSLY